MSSNKNYSTIPSDDIIHRTAEALETHGMKAYVVENAEAAKKLVLELIPENAEVMNMTSVTLDTIGLSEVITDSGKYVSNRKKSLVLDATKQAKEITILRSVATWTIGSVHAVTEDGTLLIASQSGSQLGAYVFDSPNLILVVGAQKIVSNLNDGLMRLEKHSLPLESERAHKAYGVPASAINKILILKEEIKQGRITILLVKESLGF